MSTCPRFNHLLVLPHRRIQNANAISSPLTHGFPSVTAFLGLMWALERKARTAGIALEFNAVGVICHSHQEQVTDGGFVQTFRLSRNPIDKDGSTAAIVEEGRIHLELSLVLGIYAESWDEAAQQADTTRIVDLLDSMRIAGGTLVPPERPWLRRYRPWVIDQTGADEDRLSEFRKKRMRLLPGSTLVSRDELIDQRLSALQKEQPDPTRLDAWLSLARINRRYHAGDEGAKGEWKHDRAGLGWIVPIPIGYGALGEVHPAGSVANARDSTTPFRFVESLYSVGEWIGPHRLQAPQQLLWYAHSDSDAGLYRACNDYAHFI